MRNILVALLFLATGLIKAQDTLGIDSTSFNFQQVNYYLDSLDFNYYLSKTGLPLVENIRTRINVNPGAGTDSVEAIVLVGPVSDSIDFSLPKPKITHRMVLQPAAFKNGNNTVVIWPSNGNLNTEDTIKLNVFVSGYESIDPSPLLDKVNVKNDKNGLRFENMVNMPITLRIYSLSGKVVKVLEVESYDNQIINLKEGVYFVTLLQGNKYYLHKTQVLR